MSEMIDRVARALFDETYNPAHLSLDEAWLKNSDSIQDFYRTSARIAIGAMREPTIEMIDEAAVVLPGAPDVDATHEKGARDVWRAMIGAALDGASP